MGFEPTNNCLLNDFESFAFDHSGTSPYYVNIQTNWIFELAELDGMTNKKDAAQIKSLLSSSTDNFRRPYEALT